MLLKRFFIFAVFYFQDVLCWTKSCYFGNFQCLTNNAQRVQVFENAEPIHLDIIEAELPTVKYTLRNTTLSGINTCISELIKLYISNMTYDYNIACKILVMDGLYEINGELGAVHIEGKGQFKIDYDDFVFILTGDFERNCNTKKKINKPMKHFQLEMDARGKIEYELNNLFDGNTERAATVQKYINENWKTVNKILQQPVMERFVTVILERVNKYLSHAC